MTVHLESFEKVSGIRFEILIKRFDIKDEWATFLKIAAVLESSTKRAVGIKLGIDPNLESVRKQEFFNSLLICRDTKIIQQDAFDFVNRIRIIRNDLVHNIGELDLNIGKLQRDTKDFGTYKKVIESFIKIGEASITDSKRQHFDFLIGGCIGYVVTLSDNLFNRNDATKSVSNQEEPE